MNQPAEWDVKLFPMLSWLWPKLSQPKIPEKNVYGIPKKMSNHHLLIVNIWITKKKIWITRHHEFSIAYYFMGFWGYSPDSTNPAGEHPWKYVCFSFYFKGSIFRFQLFRFFGGVHLEGFFEWCFEILECKDLFPKTRCLNTWLHKYKTCVKDHRDKGKNKFWFFKCPIAMVRCTWLHFN